ncbi:LysR family transcriptional regulator [Pseudomonas sp. JS3066]|jgi:DNA-binding transcriptional LysR family regulator|uniref:LysR family transcriptional regulator n=1 Tax=unclassified Pseudomonas TaxID=196821 RepID=UPI000EA995CA|nr:MULTISPECIES: LysR family transcriptional regulator [unclassified Pseudomonas]AYF85810.1 LysR family transcriptional regulator [Pseudomonas sp. DY-1]WVK91603.1 LysR family transcriptional regulator [Pseudomonas sp. JS3066]
METLANLESFVRSAETGSFSAAARRLALTPAAVSRNVAMLERNLSVRLFQRSTRKLTLTEAGERFLDAIGGNLEALQAAIAAVGNDQGEPAGVLKLSMAPSFGMTHILPLLPAFRARYPQVRPEWHLENRPVDLIAEGYDLAIGGGFELAQGVVARPLAPAHIIPVAAPAYLAGRVLPSAPAGLLEFDGIVLRSARSGRARHWSLRDAAGNETAAPLAETIMLNDPTAMREVALLGLGVAMLSVPDALPWLERGELVRLLPNWYADAGTISLYYPSRSLLPAKTRAFIDFLVEHFQRERLDRRFAATPGAQTA